MIKKFKVKVNNKVFEVEVEELKKAPGNIDVNTNTEPKKNKVKAEPEIEKPVIIPVIPKIIKPVVEEKTAGKHDVIAPLPGVILDILVKKGKKVKENEPVVILEAMKMENALLSPVTGIVEEIHVIKDQAVDGNYPLVTING